ncbi:MAG: aldehyde dehydrogenase family protein [Bacteroidetes bacterium]|nr:aldehyde dehydrogenase family protein [Bacteroidota bacterium]MBV6460894.1 Succinate-semialdehyde dehydrogenase [NADP(+)] GabD [Flavobacteriales bacterium]WKZ75707.1 MAG: aldehyde dehydrogenase family protein [Vicingaceae bacterium]MCL4815274.1 aldehyde dehydrogenase family protein [Flavobacteriales bacterium]NOG94616.1 aldehyde dehydrogenase family protein [Bacteroidota bacterium]
MKTYQIYLSGNWVSSSQKIEIKNPYDSQNIAHTYLASVEQVEEAIDKAQQIEEECSFIPAYLRYNALMFISNEINKKADYLAKIISAESAKPYKYAISEVQRAAFTFLIAAEECKRLPKEYLSMDWQPGLDNKEAWVKYFPVGVVSGITPFNFPLNLLAHKVAPAIATGCPIIIKPDLRTPISALELADIIHQTELPKAMFSVLPTTHDVAAPLITDNRIKLLSFTGSPKAGWPMKAIAGKKKVVLELGGNAGVIISPSAHLNTALSKCVNGAFAYSGQVCIHTQRIYVHETLFDTFTEQFVEKVKLLKQGRPENSETEISCMIDEANAVRVEEWINEAVLQGAKLLCGGKRRGNFVEPTVLTDTHSSMKVSSCEVFGPVVIIEKYSSFMQAVSEVNYSSFGLQAGLFTDSQSEIDIAFNRLKVGGVIINDVPTFRADHMPYGGIKDSGFGREGVKYAMNDMLEAKILVRTIEQ